MSSQNELKLPKWPFFAGEVVLVVFGCLIYFRHHGTPLTALEAVLLLCAGVIGAALAVTPFLLEYLAAVKILETSAVLSAVAQIQNLETVATQIGSATSQWQNVQEHANRTTKAAHEIADRMTTETAAFTEFLKKASDTERATLRLEIEKLRRAESDWLQIIVRMLDHTYALHQASVRSGQVGLIEQLGQFQNSCRELARRIGLLPFMPAANDPFDVKYHETPDPQDPSNTEPRIGDVIATGYTYQGRMIRPALVSLQKPAPPAMDVMETPEPEPVPQAEEAAANPEVQAEEGTLL